MSEFSKHPERPNKLTSSKPPHITVTQSITGWMTVMMWWNPDMGGFWEPWTTGVSKYETREQAIAEAQSWAEAEELEMIV